MKKHKMVVMMEAGLLAFSLLLGGCGKNDEKLPEDTKGNVSGQENSGTAADGGEEAVTEPALTAEAKSMKQFADPQAGDVCAEINIKDFGTITVKFFPEEAPRAVENFVTHAKEGYYDGVTFHRILDDFMIQGGDPTGTGSGGESIWGSDFEDEFSDELLPVRGALCMANAGSNTNGSQFFLVQADAATITEMERLLLAQYKVTLTEYFEVAYGVKMTEEQVALYETYGGTPWLFEHHTVFGQMIDGYEVLDAVAGVKADQNGVPEEKVIIESVKIKEYK